MLFVGFAWGMPLLLTIIAGTAFESYEQHPFLLSPAAWARYFIAVGLLILVERQVEERLRGHLQQFVRAPILAPESLAPAAEAVVKALKRRDSRVAELVCLLIATLGTIPALVLALHVETLSWAVGATAGHSALTLAGWRTALISHPIFYFLVLRWLWRHAVWGMLLRDLAGLELRLVAMHPDGHGGLAFIGQYPNVYATFVLALSCVVGATIFEVMREAGVELTAYGLIMAVWLLVALALFTIPLAAFRRPFTKLKATTILVSSAQAIRYFRAAECEVLGQNISAAQDAEPATAKDTLDPSKLLAAAHKLSMPPFTRAALLPISAAALLPLVAAGSTQLPFTEIIKVAKRLLLFSQSIHGCPRIPRPVLDPSVARISATD